ncbi:hypothetical protein BDZ91DRAFT_765417 [Kalaharituber pfeilii]|nr:hypothetical protein BDZ91DRAFT_765417 [Kalaharituber pfeilii]
MSNIETWEGESFLGVGTSISTECPTKSSTLQQLSDEDTRMDNCAPSIVSNDILPSLELGCGEPSKGDGNGIFLTSNMQRGSIDISTEGPFHSSSYNCQQPEHMETEEDEFKLLDPKSVSTYSCIGSITHQYQEPKVTSPYNTLSSAVLARGSHGKSKDPSTRHMVESSGGNLKRGLQDNIREMGEEFKARILVPQHSVAGPQPLCRTGCKSSTLFENEHEASKEKSAQLLGNDSASSSASQAQVAPCKPGSSIEVAAELRSADGCMPPMSSSFSSGNIADEKHSEERRGRVYKCISYRLLGRHAHCITLKPLRLAADQEVSGVNGNNIPLDAKKQEIIEEALLQRGLDLLPAYPVVESLLRYAADFGGILWPVACITCFRPYQTPYGYLTSSHRAFRWTLVFVSAEGLIHEWDEEMGGFQLGRWRDIDPVEVGRMVGRWLEPLEEDYYTEEEEEEEEQVEAAADSNYSGGSVAAQEVLYNHKTSMAAGLACQCLKLAFSISHNLRIATSILSLYQSIDESITVPLRKHIHCRLESSTLYDEQYRRELESKWRGSGMRQPQWGLLHPCQAIDSSKF